MVKFFLKNEKHPPQSNHKQQHQNKQNSKNKIKKVIDYRIVLWKKLFNLIKTQHSIMIQKLIRKIKQSKQKLELRQTQTQTPKQPNHQTQINSLKKDLTSLDAKYQSMKSLKKPQLKNITLYIIIEVLKIQNIQKIIEKAKLSKTLQTKKLKEQLQSNESVKKFIQKLSLLTVYQKELQACAQLVDVVQEKKLQRKTKVKQRKQRKYQKEHPSIVDQQQVQQQNDKESASDSESIEEQIPIKQKTQPIQKIEKVQKVQKSQKRSNYSKFQQIIKNNKHSQGKQYNQSSYNRQKPIHKERTQFRKTGRNKVKYEKQQKKHHFKNREKQQSDPQQQRKIPKRRGQFSFSKEQAHPSWKAKQQLKQQVYIQPFQGKKILL